MQSISLLCLTVTAAGAITSERFVTHTSTQAGAAANTLGVSRSDAVTGDNLPVDVHGTAIVEAGGTFSKGDALQTDASGMAIVKAAGVTVARALSDGVAGQRCEVLLIAN